jgi:hypothetical protein
VQALLQIEHVLKFSDLTNRIQGRKEDLLFFGCEVVGMSPGRLPVRAAPAFYENSTRFFKTAVDASAHKRAAAIPGSKPNTTLLDRLLYGQSSEGSYMVTVHVPVDTIREPLGRLLVSETVQAFSCLEVATERASDEPLLTDSLWTAPMCEAILKFAESRIFTAVKLQAAPDPVWTEGGKVRTEPAIVPLQSSPAQEVLIAAAAKLRRLKDSQKVDVVGIPYATRDDAVIGEGNKRVISIKWLRENEPPMKVQAELSQAAYEEALRAVSKCQIRISGWLRQRSSRWILEAEGMPTLLDIAALTEDLSDPDLL